MKICTVCSFNRFPPCVATSIQCRDYICLVPCSGTSTYSPSSSVDPPSQALERLSISQTLTPSSSAEELAYLDSKVDYKAARLAATPTQPDSPVNSSQVPWQEGVTSNGYFSILPDEIIRTIFSYLPFPDFCRAACVCRTFRAHSYDPSQLIRLDLSSYWHKINDNALESLAARCRRADSGGQGALMQTLNLRWVGGGDIVSSAQVNAFLDLCNLSALTRLNLGSAYCVTDHIVSRIVQAAPMIQDLNLESCDKLTAEGIRVLHKLEHLRKLNLYRTKVDAFLLEVCSHPLACFCRNVYMWSFTYRCLALKSD